MNIKNLYPENENIPSEHNIEFISQKEYLINGEIRKWDGEFHQVLSPVYIKTDGSLEQKKLGEYPLLTEKEAMEAVEAAERAFDSGRGLWPTMSVSGRIKHMEKFINHMKGMKDEVVKLIMWEIGKSWKDSIKEFDRTVQYIINTINALKDLDRKSSRFEMEEGVIGQIRRAPLGVVLCMGPFNYPLNETFATLIPAIITGNAVVFKPPKFGVLLHRPLLEAFRDSFPKGVVNTIYGDGARLIQPVMKSGKVNVLAFIGTSHVADFLKKAHPKPHRLRSVLGLEAKNTAIILHDANMDLTVGELLAGSLSYNGQRCTAIKMVFVHRRIMPEFMRLFNEAVAKLKLGMPWEKDVDITPLPEEGKCEYLAGLVNDAVSKGASVVNEHGGIYYGNFYNPAVVFPVTSEMRLYHEEQFGPVIPVAAFDDIEEPLSYVIESNYGQQVSIFGENPDRIANLIDPLVNQVARVNINCQCQRSPDVFPFTGRKDSAEGTLSVSDALRVFSLRSLVAAKENSLNKEIITDIVRNNKSNFLSTDFIF
jgi:glyceraldehyde-3-phosphate dehydrogenase (NADP+)